MQVQEVSVAHSRIDSAEPEIFAQDNGFWDNYNKGRPPVPENFFQRIFSYHQSKGGTFGTVHDVGAGNGPYAQKLRTKFDHVIVSDIVSGNISLAQKRVHGSDGFSFRVAGIEDAKDMEPGSVDMVFATNVMHFSDPQELGMAAIAHQLRRGGTFAAAAFGPARFDDPKLQDLWTRMGIRGGYQLTDAVTSGREARDRLIRILGRTQNEYNVAPLDLEWFEPGALRIHLNMEQGGIQSLVPEEMASLYTEEVFSGADESRLWLRDPGWDFVMDLEGVKEHFASFPFISQYPDAFHDLYEELDNIEGKVFYGVFPAKIILATRT